MKNALLALAALLALVGNAVAQISPSGKTSYNGLLVNETGLAYDKAYPIDLAAYEAAHVSAQVLYTSGTFTSGTFSDGNQSTGSITLPLLQTRLSSATATGSITILSTFSTTGISVMVGGRPFVGGVDFAVGFTTNAAAANLAAAINAASLSGLATVTVTAPSNVLNLSASTYGTAGNGILLATSNANIATVSAAHLGGGQDNAVITINGVTLTAQKGLSTAPAGYFTVTTSSAATRAKMVTAINAYSSLSSIVTATDCSTTAAEIVCLTSVLNSSNYAWSASTTALTLTNSTLYGGTAAAFSLGGSIITLTNSWTTALPVLYTANSASIGGLTDQTTYFVIPQPGQIKLATTSALAQAGTAIVFTSTTSQTSPNSPSLAPLAITGTPSFTWQSSNDNSHWATVLTTGTIGMTSYANPAADKLFDFGAYTFRYLRLNVTAPTAGGIYLNVPVYIKQN